VAKVGNTATRIYFDEFDLSGVLNASEQTVEQETQEVTCFSDSGPRRVVGNYDVAHSDLGLLEPADDGADEQIFTALGEAGDHYLTKLFGANAEGGVAYDSLVHISGEPRSAQKGGAVLLNFESRGSNGISRGLVLANAAVVATGQRTGRNQGATTSGQKYRVIFRVLAFNGTNITLKIQESQNDGSPDAYADVSGLTSGALTAIGVVEASTTAATEAWKRVDISGTFTSATILVTAGVVEGTD